MIDIATASPALTAARQIVAEQWKRRRITRWLFKTHFLTAADLPPLTLDEQNHRVT